MSRRLLFLILSAAGIVAAQDPPARVGRLNYVSGSVSFEPAGVTDWVPATINRPLTIGDQLYADAGARAEIHVPGVALRLGPQSAFEFMNLDNSNTQVRLSEGTLEMRVYRLNQNLEVDTPNLAFTITRPGEYRIDTNPDTFETYVTLRAGEGRVTANSGAFSVHAQQQAIVSGQDGSQYNVYQAPGYDDFDNWVVSRDQREDRLHASAGYVSPDMVGYEDLDQYGSWRSVPEYGRCWVPRDTPADWAPYQEGHWAWIDPWGWSWVDDEPWGFAPFHYGRWARFNGFWGWVPGPVAVAPVYAPALVAWVGFGGGFGASFGFGGPAVGWFPLGPRDVYVPAYGASPTYVSRVNVTNTVVINNTTVTNVYNNYLQTQTIPTANYMNRSVPGAVVAVPQNALSSARTVQQVALKVTPAQVNAIRAADPAPKVAPQVASVLGQASSAAARVPKPPAAVLSKPVVASATPPPPPAPFQQRQTLLAKNAGRPLPIQQQRQIARAAPAATRPPVRVVAQARTVTPPVTHAPAPRPASAATARPSTPPPPAQTQNATRPAQPGQRPQGQPGAPAQAQRPQVPQPARPYEPPSVQRRGQQTQAQPRPNAPPSVDRPQMQPNRSVASPQVQPRPVPQANRPYEPPTVEERRAPTVQPSRPHAAPPQQPQRAEPQPPEQSRNRSTQPPQYQPPPRQQSQQRAVPPPEHDRNRNAPPQQQTRPAPPPAERKAASPPRQNQQKKEEQKKEEP